MKQMHMMLKLAIAGACVAVMATGAMAQTADANSLSAADTAAAAAFGAPTPSSKPKTSTPRMVDEAQQRSKARSTKALATGAPEQWGSEEPFTYVPGQQF
jgi:dihydroorotate dehydrogenase